MSANPKSKLAVVTIEEAQAIRNSKITEEGIIARIYGAILMTTQKALTPSVSMSPAVIGLLVVLVAYIVGITWWAAGVSRDSDNNTKSLVRIELEFNSKIVNNKEEIDKLRMENQTQKVYIDNTREKLIKLEALLEQKEGK